MKTTIDVSEAILRRAKRLAAEQKTTLRALVEEGLRRVLEEREHATKFELQPVVYHGDGLHPEVADGSWERIRDVLYEGRGG